MSRHARGQGRAGTGRTLPVLALLLLGGTAGAMEQREGIKPAEGAPPVNSMREPPRAAAGNSTDRIVQNLERKYKAKLIKDPKERQIDGRKVLVLTLMDDKKGRVWEVRVDAQTGEEL